MHLHTVAGVAVSAQREGLLPLSQHSLFPLASLSYHDYEGVALNPDEKARLVADLLAGKPLAAGEDILPTLVAKTAGQSGRAIKQMIEIALRSAYRARSRRAGEIEIRLEDFPAENARP